MTDGGWLSTPARAFWIAAPGVGEIREEALPVPGPTEVLVRALYSAVSRGTESLVFRAKVPQSEYSRMRCPHQRGDFPAPVKYGYSSVGKVEVGPPELEGRVVFCLHPHQTLYVVERNAVTLVPDSVPPARAVLAANLETAVNALWDARPLIGDRVAVVGAGVVGCLLARLLGRLPGAEVELIDVRPERAAIAAELGVAFRAAGEASPGRDLVFHTSGSEAGLRTAIELADQGGRVIELSWFGDQPVSLPLGEAFHVQRLELRSSQVGSISPRARRRFTHASRLAFALSLLNDPAFDVLFDEEASFDELPATLSRLSGGAASVLCHRVRYD